MARNEKDAHKIEHNASGLPTALKTGIEALSGVDLSGVRVHRNSHTPAKMGAHAYTQGTDIHIAPGQDKHLAHEAWHVVQQKQGRVKPTIELGAGDSEGSEAQRLLVRAEMAAKTTNPSDGE